MEDNHDKIPSPFETPAGYMDGFEAKLAARMAAPVNRKGELKVVHKRRFRTEYVAVAAAVVAILVTAWFVFLPKNSKIEIAKTPKPVKLETPLAPATAIQDTVQLQKTETAVLESVLDEADKKTIATAVNSKRAQTPQEITIAQELEEDGLLVMDVEDGLFDEIEILP